MDAHPVEVFISYAKADEPYRRQLETHLSALKRQGLISLWHDEQIELGTSKGSVVDAHLQQAQIILLLVSADFLASDYCYSVEMKHALKRHEANEARVIPIVVRSCDWQELPIGKLQVLPRDGHPISASVSVDDAWTEVARGLRQMIEDLPVLSDGAPSPVLPRVWNIPYPRNPVFTGRDDLLQRIHSQLQTGQAMALSQAQAISGLGGIGKTQVAVEYAYQHAREYQAVLWVLSDTRESLVSGYIALAELLDLPQKSEQDQAVIIQAVKSWLRTHGSWLLILDNADDLTMVREFIPPLFNGHILLTTRAQTTGKLAQRIEVETMPQDVGALFLLRRAKLIAPDTQLTDTVATDDAFARKICNELGGLPLALDQAGAYIESNQCSLSDYLHRYQMRGAYLLKQRGDLVDDHPSPVATTWSLSFEKAEQICPAAGDLLRVCAFLAADAIPEEIITQGSAHLGELLQTVPTDPFLLDEAIGALRAYSLMRRDSVSKTLSIHRLVQAIVRGAMETSVARLWKERVLRAMHMVLPAVEHGSWPQWERVLSHAQMCTQWIESEALYLPEAAKILQRTGWYLMERARYAEAEPLLEQAYMISEKERGPDHLDTARDAATLGYFYGEQEKYKQAEPLLRRALEIREQQLGEMHPDTARSLNNLAGLYRKQGKHEQAEPLYQRALSITEQKLGEMHPNTAKTLNNLALLYDDQGKYEEAEPLYQRSLSIREQKLGAMHPDTAVGLHNLATFYGRQGKYEAAEPLYKRALLIFEQTLGETHPNTHTVRQWYVSLLRKTGRDEEATALERQGQLPSDEH